MSDEQTMQLCLLPCAAAAAAAAASACSLPPAWVWTNLAQNQRLRKLHTNLAPEIGRTVATWIQ